MADIELVIKIPKEDYKAIKNMQAIGDLTIPYVFDAIRNGTSLPKGHGRLIDADALKSLCYEVFLDTDNPNRADGLSVANGVVEEDINLVPTIIEANRKSE